VHLARLGLARFEEAQRLGDRDLEDQDLAFGQRLFRDAVAGLDDRGLAPGAPVLRTVALNVTPGGGPVEYGVTLFAGDRVVLTVAP
jgi:hypothetical protein